MMRKLIGLTTLTLKADHGVDEDGAKVFYFTQAASVAITGLSEEKEIRYLDGRERSHSSALFGASTAQSRLVNLATATGHDEKPLDPLLTEGFLDEGEAGGENNLLDLIVNHSRGWVMEQLWGFGIINDERRLKRKMLIRKGGEVAHVTAWYDWTG